VTGWRKNAIATLEWSDVRDGNIYLRGKYSKNGKPYFVPVMGELKQLVARREAVHAVVERSNTRLSLLVFHRGGHPINEFRKSWDSAAIAAQLGTMVGQKCGNEGAEKRCAKCRCRRKYVGRIFHDLRRSAARNLIRAGVTQAVAMKITGHTTTSMFTRYNITNEDDLRDAMRKVSEHDQSSVGRQNVVTIAK
jgi:integrase